MRKSNLMFYFFIIARLYSMDSTYYAIRLTGSVEVDGMLTEPIWQTAPVITDFLQYDPNEGAPASLQTYVQIAYDDNALYVGATMEDTAPDSIVALLARRDNIDEEDFFAMDLDTYHDHRSGFIFGLSAGGTLFDGVSYNDDWTDESWDSVWEGRVHRDNKGWTAEFRIPFSQLRFRKQDKHIWGINFRRDITRRNERTFLVFTPKGSSGFVSRFPHLEGIEGISSSRHIEILPYTRIKAAYTHPDVDDPFHERSDYTPDAGADVKIGLSNNLILDMTINPDFGQVEVDPAVVNLSDIETFYEEKRPFFIEGASTFGFGYGGASQYWTFNWSDPSFFYSRRIGSAPRREWPDNDFADVPEGVHILGAAKITGKLADQWNVGTVHALTRKETGSFSMDGNKSDMEMEPLTYYGICRAQREINEGRQGIGMISTLTRRRFTDQTFRSELNDQAMSFGMDGWSFLDTSRTWVVAGWLGGSYVSGTTERIIDLQRSSSHYFQRPDAGHIHVDSSTTHLSGYAGRIYLNKQRGHVIINSAVGFISPGFEINDLGFLSRADWINSHFGIGYLWPKPGKVFRWADLITAVHQSTDYEGNNLWRGIWFLGEGQFLNYMTYNASFFYNPETLDKYRTRGGPITVNHPGFGSNVFFQTNARKPWVLESFFYIYHRTANEWTRQLEVELQWKPRSNVDLQMGPELTINREYAQWVDAFDDPYATHTYGARYVFADMKQTEISANIRVNWTFTPRLSFQLYLQPLISHGNYYTFKELSKPRTHDYHLYSDDQIVRSNGEYEIDPDGAGPAESFVFDNPDFDFKSLRGNAVLRWEYLPGSTLYLVWAQNRWDDHVDEPFTYQKSIDRLTTTKADNIFMLKLTYWWGL